MSHRRKNHDVFDLIANYDQYGISAHQLHETIIESVSPRSACFLYSETPHERIINRHAEQQ